MAQVSAFGFSGWDPVGSFGESTMASYFNRKMMERNAALQYKYAQRYAENTPTWQVKGLRDAGLNPILAVSNGVSFGGSAPSIPQTDDFQGGSYSFNGTVMRKVQQKQAEAEIKTQESQQKLNDANAEVAKVNAKANTMQAQAAVAESNARIAKIQQEVRNNDEGGGFRSAFIADLSRFIQRELYHVPTSSDDKSGYLYNGPSYDEQVISFFDGSKNGKVYMDSDEFKKYGTKEAAVKEFFRRVGESQKRYDDDKKRKQRERIFDTIFNRKGRNITPW